MLLLSLLGNGIHQLVGVVVLVCIVSIVIIVVISLCIHRHLASNGDTNQSKHKQVGSRDKMAAAHVTCQVKATLATDNKLAV